MEDVEGDNNQGKSTLPIALGIDKTSKVVFGLGIIVSAGLLWLINNYLMENKFYYAVVYALLFVVAPMIFFVIKIWNGKSKSEFHFLSTLLKFIIFFGILSILVITLSIKYDVKG